MTAVNKAGNQVTWNHFLFCPDNQAKRTGAFLVSSPEKMRPSFVYFGGFF